MERVEMKLLQLGPAEDGKNEAMSVSLMPNGLQAWVALPLNTACPDSESFSCVLKGLAMDEVKLVEQGPESFSPDPDDYFSHICGRVLRWAREAGSEHVLRIEVRCLGMDLDIFVDRSLIEESRIKPGAYLIAYIFLYADFGTCIEQE